MLESHSEIQSPSVCVVIPTKGRPDRLSEALRSVWAQTRQADQVVVVVDGPDPATETLLGTLRGKVDVLLLPESRGAAAARNAGIAKSRCQWVAFLDDDDVWDPEKLERQVRHVVAASYSDRLVVATGAVWKTDSGQFIWPTRGPRAGEGIADYLFVRTAPGEGMLATPTLMLPTNIALSVPMPEHLSSHEDYDWLLSLEDAGVVFEVILQPLATVQAAATRQSLSRNTRWVDSLAWAEARRARMGELAFSAFLLTQVARLAAPSGIRSALHVLRVSCTGRPRPRDLARFALIVAFPESMRWRVGQLISASRT